MKTKDEIIAKQDELKSYPFCGGEAHKTFIGNNHTKQRSVIIKCLRCFTEQRTGAIRNTHEWCDKIATEKWNKRTRISP